MIKHVKNSTLAMAVILGLSATSAVAGIADKCELIPRWDEKSSYKSGEWVQYAGKAYDAKWWTKGKAPDSNNQDGPWQVKYECLVASDINPPLPLGKEMDLSIFEQINENDPYIDVHRLYPGVYVKPIETN